jgi:chorismate mutase
MRRLGRSTLLGLCLLVAGCGPPASPPQEPVERQADQLLEILRQRLLLMHDVARWKWHAGRPILDPAREDALLDAVSAQGRARGLDADFVRTFFAAQMEAARTIQERDHARWRATGSAPGQGPPLDVLRERIDALNGELLDRLAEAPLDRPAYRQRLVERAPARLTGDGIDATVRALVLRPWLSSDPR